MFLGDHLNMFVAIMIPLNLVLLPAILTAPSGLTGIKPLNSFNNRLNGSLNNSLSVNGTLNNILNSILKVLTALIGLIGTSLNTRKGSTKIISIYNPDYRNGDDILVGSRVEYEELDDPDPCDNVSKPVCAGGKNGYSQTFDNECKLNEYVSMFPLWSKSHDGPCDCGTCSNTSNPVCYLNGDNVEKNIQFLNECYYRRYKCLHGVFSVGFKQNDGRCQICQKPIKYDHPSDPQWADYYKNNVAWINFVAKCGDDTSPLVAE